MMVFLAYPSKAFLPAPSAQLIRHTRTFSKSTLFPQTAARRPRNALRYAGLPKRNIHGAATQSQRALVSLSATDDAKEAAVAAVQEAEKALNRAVDDAGVAGNADNVQAAVTAARAAARNAMDSLRRQGSGFGDIGESTQDIPAWRQVSYSYARCVFNRSAGATAHGAMLKTVPEWWHIAGARAALPRVTARFW